MAQIMCFTNEGYFLKLKQTFSFFPTQYSTTRSVASEILCWGGGGGSGVGGQYMHEPGIST